MQTKGIHKDAERRLNIYPAVVKTLTGRVVERGVVTGAGLFVTLEGEKRDLKLGERVEKVNVCMSVGEDNTFRLVTI